MHVCVVIEVCVCVCVHVCAYIGICRHYPHVVDIITGKHVDCFARTFIDSFFGSECVVRVPWV